MAKKLSWGEIRNLNAVELRQRLISGVSAVRDANVFGRVFKRGSAVEGLDNYDRVRVERGVARAEQIHENSLYNGFWYDAFADGMREQGLSDDDFLVLRILMAPKKFDDMRTVGRMVQSLRWIMRYNEALRKSRGDVYDGLLSFGTRKFVRKEKRFPGSFERYLPRYEEVRVVQIPAPVVVPKPVYQIIEQPRLSFVQTGREGTDYFSGVRGRFGSSARQGELDLN